MMSYEKIYDLFEQEMFEECFSLCLKLIESYPDDPNIYYAWFYKGKSEYEFGDAAAAIQSFNRSILLSPDEEQIWVSLGCAYEMIDEKKNAWNAYRKEIELFPRNCFGWQKLAGFLTRIKKFKLAKKIFDKVRDAGGIDYTISASQYAIALYEAGDLEEELQFYNELRKMNYSDDWIDDNYNELLAEIEKSLHEKSGNHPQ